MISTVVLSIFLKLAVIRSCGVIWRNQVLLLISKELNVSGGGGLGFAFLSAPFPVSPPPSLNTHRDFHNLGRRSSTLL